MPEYFFKQGTPAGPFADYDSSPEQRVCHRQTGAYPQAADSQNKTLVPACGEKLIPAGQRLPEGIIKGSSLSFRAQLETRRCEDTQLSQRHSYSEHADHTVHGAVLPPDGTVS